MTLACFVAVKQDFSDTRLGVWSGAAGGAAAEERDGVPFDREVSEGAESGELFGGQADIHVNHAMAGGAGQVMVVAVAAADTIAVRAVGKIDAIEQAGVDQHFDGAIDRGSAQARLTLAQILPEIVHREITTALGQFTQALGDQAARASVALAFLVKHGVNFFAYHKNSSFPLTGRGDAIVRCGFSLLLFYHTKAGGISIPWPFVHVLNARRIGCYLFALIVL